MDSIELIKIHNQLDDFSMRRMRHLDKNEIPRKPRKITLVQFHWYKTQEERIQIILSQVPPRNFHEMRRALQGNRRTLAELESEHDVQKFFTLIVKVNEKQSVNDAIKTDL